MRWPRRPDRYGLNASLYELLNGVTNEAYHTSPLDAMNTLERWLIDLSPVAPDRACPA